MDTSRLSRVHDCCPSDPRARWYIHNSIWYASIAESAAPVIMEPGGYTCTILNNFFISWFRTFTVAPQPPAQRPSRALIQIHEWLSPVEPRGVGREWHSLGMCHKEGIVFFDELGGGSHTAHWSTQARRHLKDFQKIGARLRLGTYEEFCANIIFSQIPVALQSVFIHLLERFIRAHPADTEILVAENAAGEILACFAVANCAELKQSYYITGFFNTSHEKSRAMVGLVDWWFTRSRAAGMSTLSFGDMCSPRALPIEHGRGYTIFKTHFGARRVWFPKNLWKIQWRKFFQKN